MRLPLLRQAVMLVLLSSVPSSACPSGYTSYDSKTCFKVHCAAKSLADARAQCAADGGSLAIIQDADQNEAVRQLKEACGVPWVTIGLTSEGSRNDSCWHWSGYSSWTSYQNWDDGQPANHWGYEDCVAMGMHEQPGAGKWHDCGCNELCMGTGALPFACRIDLVPEASGSSACPGNCNAALEQGQCDVDSGSCTCYSGYKGADCGCPESATCDTVTNNGVTSNCVKRAAVRRHEDCYSHLDEAGWNAAYEPKEIPECAFSACNGEGGHDFDCCAEAENAGCALGNVYLSEAACHSWEEGGTEGCALRVCCSMANEPPAGFTHVHQSTCPADLQMLKAQREGKPHCEILNTPDEDPDHLPACWVVPPYEARRVGGRLLYGLSGMPAQFAREADENFAPFCALYVLATLVSAVGVSMAWRRRVRLVRVGVAYATKGFMRFANALLVYYVLQLLFNLIVLVTFFSIRCGFHNVGTSPGNVAARTLYQLTTMGGGVFTNAVLELVLLRKAQMMEGFATRGKGCNRCIAWLIWVQIILLPLTLPFAAILIVNLVSKGPANAFDYNDDGRVERSEDPTKPFQATMGLFGLVHVVASITLCAIFVQLLRLAQRRNRIALEGSAPGPRVNRADTSTQAPCTATHSLLLSPTHTSACALASPTRPTLPPRAGGSRTTNYRIDDRRGAEHSDLLRQLWRRLCQLVCDAGDRLDG